MIIEWVVGRMIAVGTAVIGLLPADPNPAGSLDLSGVVHLYGWLNEWSPVAETIDLLVLTVQVLVIIGTVLVVVWLLKRLPFGLGGT